MMKRINILTGLFLLFALGANKVDAAFWLNDLRTLFTNNKAIIYTINVRSFAAEDKNNNDIIEPWLGDVSGTFTGAEKQLNSIVMAGANTVYLLPITKTGKLKALGTAGSLYAMDSFNEINPQLDDKKDPRTVFEEAKSFIAAAHKKKIRVIIDLPSCGSYDLSLEKPELFVKDKQGKTVVPADWTDVRLFKVYNDNGTLNEDLVNNYKKFIDMAFAIGADGIRADVAAIKPYEFWKEIIDYARKMDPQFMFLAEASPSWSNPVKEYAEYTPVTDLLRAGFDGYYGDWANFMDITKAKDFHEKIKTDLEISKEFKGQKTTIASFATHDQLSPLIAGNVAYWKMILWLNVTLPTNSYFLDGYNTGDRYLYKYENQKASKTFTDDDQYFVHRGKMDIFNFSRKPNGGSEQLKEIYITALKFKYWAKNLVIDGAYMPLKTADPGVFAYARVKDGDAVVVIGNLDTKNEVSTRVYIPKIKPDSFVSPVTMIESPTTKNGRLEVKLKPYEIQVFMLSKIGLKAE